MKIASLLATISAVLAITFSGLSQERVQIKDMNTLETIPFVKVTFDNKRSVLADIDGYFTLYRDSVKSIKLKTLGYYDSSMSVIDITNQEIFLIADVKLLDEVKILPGEN